MPRTYLAPLQRQILKSLHADLPLANVRIIRNVIERDEMRAAGERYGDEQYGEVPHFIRDTCRPDPLPSRCPSYAVLERQSCHDSPLFLWNIGFEHDHLDELTVLQSFSGRQSIRHCHLLDLPYGV